LGLNKLADCSCAEKELAGGSWTGRTISNYVVLNSSVPAAWVKCIATKDMKLGRDVAFKCCHPPLFKDTDRRMRFEAEARLSGRTEHRILLRYTGFQEAVTTARWCLELVEGPTLARHSPRQRYSDERSVRIARQLADALDAAHAKNISPRSEAGQY